jgi:hypothetical protein
MTGCKEYRLSHGLDPFPVTESPPLSSPLTVGRQMKMVAYAISRAGAILFLSPWLDWCAGRFKVRNPIYGPNVKLDVRVGQERHVITVPQHIADGLCGGTGEHRPITFPFVIVTISYVGLVVTQFGLSLTKGLSSLSVSLWGAATAAAIMATACLGGFPLVCSGIT